MTPGPLVWFLILILILSILRICETSVPKGFPLSNIGEEKYYCPGSTKSNSAKFFMTRSKIEGPAVGFANQDKPS